MSDDETDSLLPDSGSTQNEGSSWFPSCFRSSTRDEDSPASPRESGDGSSSSDNPKNKAAVAGGLPHSQSSGPSAVPGHRNGHDDDVTFRPTSKPSFDEKIIKSRLEQEREEHRAVMEIVKEINSEDKYCIKLRGLCLGERLQKYWCIGTGQGIRGEVLMTVAPLSKRCTLIMNKYLSALNSLLTKLGKHPLLHPIHEVGCYGDKVVLFQPLMKDGSLRDHLHKVDSPMKDWAEKYEEKGKRRMKREEVALCGRTILEVLHFLYDLGFPPLGHIQTGNIFKTSQGYQLGGYENTLLGYKSRYHHLCLEYGNAIDIILLGRVLYEMASEGREFATIVPENSSSDYKQVKDGEIVRVLKTIFSMVVDGTMEDVKSRVEELLRDDFFASVPDANITTGFNCEATGREKHLLKEVTDGRENVQQREVKSQGPDKEKMVGITNSYLAKRKYSQVTVEELESIGTRPGKFWWRVQKEEGKKQLLSVAKVSEGCPIVLTPKCVATIKEFFINCKLPNLFLLDDLKYYDGYVLLVQQFMEHGSLKDIIYGTAPWLKWSEKINDPDKPLKKDRIRLYSNQILTACQVLYRLGFPQLGQIQSGNIFVEGDTLRLGGFENTLVGYSAVDSEKFQLFEANLDRIMFGHVVFEMGAGSAVDTSIPSNSDYSKIKDGAVKRFVKDVFAGVEQVVTTDDSVGGTTRDWTELLSHEFLRGIPGDLPSELENVSGKMKDILKTVGKGRARKQRGLTLMGAAMMRALPKFRPIKGPGNPKFNSSSC